jgi:hypothetical protein
MLNLLKLSVLLLVSCGPKFPTGELCGPSQDRINELSCTIEGIPNQAGEDWRKICVRAEKEGRVPVPAARCIINAQTCDGVDECLRH